MAQRARPHESSRDALIPEQKPASRLPIRAPRRALRVLRHSQDAAVTSINSSKGDGTMQWGKLSLALLLVTPLAASATGPTSGVWSKPDVKGAQSCTDHAVPSIAQCPAGTHVTDWNEGIDDIPGASAHVGLETVLASEAAVPNGRRAVARSIPSWHVCLHVEVSCEQDRSAGKP